MKQLTIALVGNPNVGKTALINTISGSRLKVGNWPGVTVEKKEAEFIYNGCKIKFIDLPGVYSLQTHSKEEGITRDFLQNESVDLIINVLDSNNLERNLDLTLQIMEFGVPILLGLNFWREFKNKGYKLNQIGFERKLGLKVLPIEAVQNISKNIILESIFEVIDNSKNVDSKRFVSDEGRYKFISNLLKTTLKKPKENKKDLTDFLDRIFLHKVFGLPIFFGLLYLVFKLTFDGSSPFIEWIEGFINTFLGGQLSVFLQKIGSPDWLKSLFLDGIVSGVGTVLTFVPLIAFLYFFLALLQESGYITRAAFLMDRFMKPLGLNGKAFVPMLVGLGCGVPAVYASRMLDTTKERKLAVAINSFVSCGAKLPIYTLFTAIFFEDYQPLIILAIYLLGILVAIIWGLILKKYLFKTPRGELIIELAPYRLPTVKMIKTSVFSKIKSFIKNAGTTITIVMIAIWGLLNLPFGVEPKNSALGGVSVVVSPVFEPLGFGDSWQATASVVPGFLAKEAVVGALASAYQIESEEEEEEEVPGFWEGLGDQVVGLKDATIDSVKGVAEGVVPGAFAIENKEDSDLESQIKEGFTPLSSFSFMTFNLLLISCAAVMGAIKAEFGRKYLFAVIGMTVGTAYIVSLLIYQIGSLLGF